MYNPLNSETMVYFFSWSASSHGYHCAMVFFGLSAAIRSAYWQPYNHSHLCTSSRECLWHWTSRSSEIICHNWKEWKIANLIFMVFGFWIKVTSLIWSYSKLTTLWKHIGRMKLIPLRRSFFHNRTFGHYVRISLILICLSIFMMTL